MNKIPPTILSVFLLQTLSAVAQKACNHHDLEINDTIYLPTIKHLVILGWCHQGLTTLSLTPLGEKAFLQLHNLPSLKHLAAYNLEQHAELRAHNCATDACGLLDAVGRPPY